MNNSYLYQDQIQNLENLKVLHIQAPDSIIDNDKLFDNKIPIISTSIPLAGLDTENEEMILDVPVMDQKPQEDDEDSKNLLHYEINDVPAWYITMFLGFQNYLMIAGVITIIPSQLSESLCMKNNDSSQADLISTIIFVSGIVTILQSTFGSRLPIIQGGSFNFLIPTLAILSLDEWKCKPNEDETNSNSWRERMREIQGAIIVSSIFQIFVGFFGLVGIIVRFVTPITIASAILTLGLSLFKAGGDFASSNWLVSISTIILTIIFSQYFGSIKVPIPFTKSLKHEKPLRYPFFQVLPIFLSVMFVWFICFILTMLELLPESNEARTDAKLNIIKNASWFRVPYPFQWGIPTVSANTAFGMLSGVIVGIVESIGDYYACARIVGAKPPPVHAVNRGIFIEGLGCVIAGIWGTGNGTTSYSENIGAISITRVGSRRVIQVTGLVMMICSLIAKVGGIFVSVPKPIVGGVVCVSFSIITAVGISNLKSVNLSSVRNLFIIGFSTFFALTVSQWIDSNPNHIDVGITGLNQIFEVILKTGIFLAGLLALVLDNTIPGTLKERGLLDWPGCSTKTNHPETSKQEESPSDFDRGDETYDLPFGMEYLNGSSWSNWLPISPTFKQENYSKLLSRRLCKKNKMMEIVA